MGDRVISVLTQAIRAYFLGGYIMTRRLLGIIGLTCAVTVVALWQGAGAGGTDSDLRPRWEYAQFRVKGNNFVFCQGTQESVVTPPSDQLPSRRISSGPNTARYVVNTTAKRNHTVAALDVFGRDGWEAVSVTSAGAELTVLMKRPY